MSICVLLPENVRRRHSDELLPRAPQPCAGSRRLLRCRLRGDSFASGALVDLVCSKLPCFVMLLISWFSLLRLREAPGRQLRLGCSYVSCFKYIHMFYLFIDLYIYLFIYTHMYVHVIYIYIHNIYIYIYVYICHGLWRARLGQRGVRRLPNSNK